MKQFFQVLALLLFYFCCYAFGFLIFCDESCKLFLLICDWLYIMFLRRPFIYIAYIIGFFFVIYLCLSLLKDDSVYPEGSKIIPRQLRDLERSSFLKPKHKLAVLVPFRDRFNELLKFAPYMTKFLNNQSVLHQIYVLNQVDNYRFNRASLINVGFKYASNKCDYMAMHDVDLLPLNSQLKYDYPKTGVFHVSGPLLHPKYNYPTFVGGILLIKREDFELVNGMSNRYWGWGLEDDEFYVRLKDANIEVVRPENISTGKNNTFLHYHDKHVRKRDMQKCFNQREVTHKRDHVTGLHDVNYEIESVQEMVIDDAHLQVLNIRLKCDRSLTPWCTCDPLPQDKQSPPQKSRNSSNKIKHN